MRKKFTFLLMALLALAGFKSWGQESQTITIGTGTATFEHMPFNSFYNYSYAQMLYLGNEIGESGTITSISFYAEGRVNANLKLKIYMKCVDRNSYSNSNDWESVTAGDLVYENDSYYAYPTGWITFTLDEFFQYDNSKNLMIAFDNNTGSYYSSKNFRYTYTSSNTCIYQRSDDTNIDPLSPSQANGPANFRPNIQITIEPSASCPKPTGLAASNITATGATISWTGNDAESYDLAYGVASTFDLSNHAYTLEDGLTATSVTLSGLTAETEYKCAVKAHCSDEEESAWSDVVSFMPTATKVLTVCDGNNTNEKIPIYGGYADSDYKSQFIFPAQYLESMQGGIIKSMTFYAQQANVNIPGTWSVYLSEVDGTTLSGLQDWNDLENVVEGQTMTISGNKLTVNFPTPFEYNGGNLLIGFNETVSGTTYPTTTWYGVNQSTNTAYYRYFYYSESAGPIQFLPKTTFAYEDGAEKFAITLIHPEDAAVGTISADYEQAAAGTTVTLSANFNLGYTLNYFMVDGVQIVGNTFEMPEHNVTVSVAYNTLTMYAITFDPEIDDDIISVSATYNGEPVTAAPAGTEITLSYSNLDEGYIFNNWTLNGAQLPGSTFEMPEEDAVIGVNLTERERYDVTINSDVQDYIIANPSSDILDGTTVTLTISPAAGYVLTELHVLDEGENEQAVTINPENSNIRTFVMPESDVTVSAVFSPVYNISIDMALVGGSISQMSTQGTLTAYPAGTQVFLSAIPDTDYSFVENSFIVTRSDGQTGPTVTYTNMMYSFIMPESNVTVSATFNKTAFAVSQVITPMYSGSFSVSKTAHVGIGETVTLSNFNAQNGYYFDFEDVNSLVVKRNDNQANVDVNNFGNIYQFAMPASDVTVTATFKVRPRYEVVIGSVTNGTVTFSYGEPDDHKYMSGETVYLEVNPASSDYTLESITATPSEGSAITPQPYYGGPKYYFTMPDFELEESTVTVTATFREFNTYTINYYVNGQLDRTMQCKEDRFVNNDGPQNVAVPAGMTFEGWGIAEIGTYTTEKPAVLGNAEYPTQDYDLYAVLSYTESVPAGSKDDKWVEVTSPSDLKNNDQVIIVKKLSNVVMCDRSGEFSGSFEKATISIYNNEITSLPSNAVILTAIDNSGNWKFSFNDAHVGQSTLSDYNGGYLVPYGLWNPSCDTWTIEQDGSSVYLRDTQFNANLAFHNGYFTCNQYTNSQAQLFKKYNPVITTNYYMTSVLTEGTVTENTTAKNIIITTGTVTVNNDIVLTMAENGLFRNEDAADFVFKDGAQLIYNGAEKVNATFEKNIAEANTRDSEWSGWYTISSPLANSVEFTEVENLIPTYVEADNYDLYRLNEAAGMWENARVNEGEALFSTIDKGLGYIYANNAGADHIAFAGEVNVEDVECTLTNDALNGFNLIGNPFSQNITLANVTGTAELADGFYVLNNDNTWGTEPMTGEIKPLQGFLVQATADGDATISKPTSAPSKGERSNEQNTNIEIIVSNSSYRDNAYAMFGEGIGLNKISHRNAEAPMVYIPQGGEDFAIAFMDENTTVFPLNFKAMTTGKYSISLKATEDVNTLVLIDNQTGVETNMLLEESYSFIGSPADRDNRFTVKLGISQNNGQNDDEHFVYQYGNELVIDGEGMLQVFDVLGRVVISEEVHGQRVNIGNLVKGTYIVRMTGENVMTQKIIVK